MAEGNDPCSLLPCHWALLPCVCAAAEGVGLGKRPGGKNGFWPDLFSVGSVGSAGLITTGPYTQAKYCLWEGTDGGRKDRTILFGSSPQSCYFWHSLLVP